MAQRELFQRGIKSELTPETFHSLILRATESEEQASEAACQFILAQSRNSSKGPNGKLTIF